MKIIVKYYLYYLTDFLYKKYTQNLFIIYFENQLIFILRNHLIIIPLSLYRPMMMKGSTTVEDRIKRNMFNVQRTKADLEGNFLRK